MSHTLWDFIKDLNWNVLHKPDPVIREYWDFVTRRMAHNKGSKTVKVVFREMRSLTTLTTDSMNLEITSYNTLRIVNEENGRRYTILSYKISTRDLGNNDTHSASSGDTDGYLSSWLRSKPLDVETIENKIIEDVEYEQWACDTLRRRLIGLNKLPNLDALFDTSADTLETTSCDERRIDEWGTELAFTMADEDELLNMKKLFGFISDKSSSSDECESENHSRVDHELVDRFVMDLNESQPMVDFSWLDFVQEPFRPSISNDSAITNKYFDDFIDDYTKIFGLDLYRFFVRKPGSILDLIELKRKRMRENQALFTQGSFHDIV
jgi:hypothetical protein